MPTTAIQPPQSSTRTIAVIIAISALASALICWLVYFHAPSDVTGTHLRFLPFTNAFLNALSTVALLFGFYFIRTRQIPKHRMAMLTAFVFSSIFLVSYLTNFTLHGETKFPRGNPLWSVPLSALGVTQERPIFSSTRRPPPAAVAATPSEEAKAAPPPKPPDVPPPLVLVGAVVGEGDAIAILLDQTDQKVIRMRQGESRAGWSLTCRHLRRPAGGSGGRHESGSYPAGDDGDR